MNVHTHIQVYVLLGSVRMFPAVTQPIRVVNCKLAAWHKGSMDRANEVFSLFASSDLFIFYRFMSCICALVLAGGGNPVVVKNSN